MKLIVIVMCVVVISADTAQPEPECYSGSGMTYKGSLSFTKSGIPCQRWDSQTPHKHGYTYLAAEGNSCRNLGGTGSRPWCYTIDAGESWPYRWDHCELEKCDEPCVDRKPWCEKSGIVKGSSYCEGENKNWATMYCKKSCGLCGQKADPLTLWAYNEPPACYDGSKRDDIYKGTLSNTVTGLPCQHWNTATPHTICPESLNVTGKDTKAYSVARMCRTTSSESNYCRNPGGWHVSGIVVNGGGKRPWCYTVDPRTTWDYCNLWSCDYCSDNRHWCKMSGIVKGSMYCEGIYKNWAMANCMKSCGLCNNVEFGGACSSDYECKINIKYNPGGYHDFHGPGTQTGGCVNGKCGCLPGYIEKDGKCWEMPVSCLQPGIYKSANDISKISNIMSPVDCQSQCQSLSGCNTWSYASANGTCWLKDGKSSAQSLNVDIISGPKECPFVIGKENAASG